MKTKQRGFCCPAVCFLYSLTLFIPLLTVNYRESTVDSRSGDPLFARQLFSATFHSQYFKLGTAIETVFSFVTIGTVATIINQF